MNWIKRIIEKYFQSYESNEQGYSRKKIIATFAFITGIGIQIKYALTTVDFDQMQPLVIIDFSLVTTLFGINAYQGVASAKTTSTATLVSTADKTVAQTTETKGDK